MTVSITDRINRGIAAKDIIERDVFGKVCDALIAEQFAVFVTTDPYDDKGREKCHAYAVSIEGIKTTLENWAFDAQQLMDDRGKDEG